VDEIANPLSISSILSEYFAYGHEFFNMNDGANHSQSHAFQPLGENVWFPN